MATFWKIAAHSVDRVFPFVLFIFRFGFVSWSWDLIASVPDLYIVFTLISKRGILFLSETRVAPGLCIFSEHLLYLIHAVKKQLLKYAKRQALRIVYGWYQTVKRMP